MGLFVSIEPFTLFSMPASVVVLSLGVFSRNTSSQDDLSTRSIVPLMSLL
uniref:Uncharacterized protein n=1 Tax=Anguilla anguilla TaxID=7936 RepID=A0A0E9TY19_ANGAN